MDKWTMAFLQTGWFYRVVMRVAHRYSWHYAPEFGPLEDGRYQRWCHWCGFRETFIRPGTELWKVSLLPSYDPRSQEFQAKGRMGQTQSPYVCDECLLLNVNWYDNCPHAEKRQSVG